MALIIQLLLVLLLACCVAQEVVSVPSVGGFSETVVLEVSALVCIRGICGHKPFTALLAAKIYWPKSETANLFTFKPKTEHVRNSYSNVSSQTTSFEVAKSFPHCARMLKK
jgi:hypothetical protein